MATGHGNLYTAAGKMGTQIGSLLKRVWDKDSEGSQGLRLLVTGKSGEGKSTLVNGLLGAKVAVEGAGSERITTKVEEYKADLEGVPVTVFDSPGLQDGTGDEDQYIDDMKKKCQTLSLVLYCTKMTNNRLKDEDKHAIVKLTKEFGQKFWKYAVLVLTFANHEDVERRDERDKDEGPEPDDDDEESWKELKKKRFEGRLKKWKDGFHKFLIEEVGVQRDIVERILVVPAGDHRVTRKNKEPYRLPDRDDWFKELWLACILRVKGMKLFLQINKSRIVAEDEVETGAEVTAEEESEWPEELKQFLEANENIQDLLDVQDSTLQLTDAPAVDETYTPKLQENIKKMDKEAWVKGQEAQLKEKEEEIRKRREEVERQLAKERRQEIKRQEKERSKEIKRQEEERSKEVKRLEEERSREIKRQEEERSREIKRQDKERSKERERQNESDINNKKVILTESDLKKIAHESFFRIFGETIANASEIVWNFVAKQFKSLFQS